MNGDEVELQIRAGSFLPEHTRVGKHPWKRNKKATQIRIQRRIVEDERQKAKQLKVEIAEQQAAVMFQRMALELFIWRFERLHMRLPNMESNVKNKAHVTNFPKLPKRMELFVTYLLHLLHVRGDVMHYGWHEMYKEGECIDGLGVDQWCLLAPKHGGLFCFIDTKSSPAGVAGQRHKHRSIIYAFYPGIHPKYNLLETEIQAIADRLLFTLKEFFASDPVEFIKQKDAKDG